MLTAVLQPPFAPAPPPAVASPIETPRPGWVPPTGIAPGAPVAFQTPGGLLSGRVLSAELETRFDIGWTDCCTPDGSDGIPPTGGPGPSRWGAQQSQRLDLRVRLDADALTNDPTRVGGIARRAAELIEQEQTRRTMALATYAGSEVNYLTYTVAGAGTAGTTPTGLCNSSGDYNTYGTTATTSTWANTAATVEGIQAAMVQWRSMSAASATSRATVGSRLWYADAMSEMYTATADAWEYTTSPAWTDIRISTTYTYADAGWHLASGDLHRPKKPEDRLREMIRDRMAPAVVRARDWEKNPVRPGLRKTDDFRELRARETLAKVIGDDRFRRFVRDGFVTCKAKSGRTYQIFPGGNFTRVYAGGKEEDRLCVVLNGQFPPTDSLIVRYLMILNDEAGFRKLAVNQGQGERRREAEARDARPLAEVYRSLKQEYGTYGGGRTRAARPPAAKAAG